MLFFKAISDWIHRSSAPPRYPGVPTGAAPHQRLLLLARIHWPQGAGILLAGLCTAALLSFDLKDPSLTNLRAHSQGVGNWVGLPGALFGGSLLEVFGTASLLVPLLVLNYTLVSRGRPPPAAYTFWGCWLLAAASAAHGLLGPLQGPGLGAPGLAGWAGELWAHRTTGREAALAVLAFLGLYAANRVVYAPPLREGVFRIVVAAGKGVRRSRRALNAGETGLREALAPPRTRGSTWRLGAALFDLLAFWRWSSLAAIKARQPSPAAGGAGVPGSTAPAIASGGGDRDEFDAWLEGLAGNSPEMLEPDWPPPPPERPSATPAPDLPGGGAPPPQPETAPEETAGSTMEEFSGEDALAARGAGPDAGPEAGPPPEAEPLEAPPSFSELLSGEGAFEPLPPAGPAAPTPGLEQPAEAKPAPNAEYDFAQPEAEAAWRERFQRYARNLDLDWQDQLWGGAGPEEDEEPPPAGEQDEH